MANFSLPECNSNKDAVIILQDVKIILQELLSKSYSHVTRPLSEIDIVQRYLDPTFDTNNYEEYIKDGK